MNATRASPLARAGMPQDADSSLPVTALEVPRWCITLVNDDSAVHTC